MTTPETPANIPLQPEMDPTSVMLDALKAEVANMTTSALVEAVKNTKEKAEDIKQENEQRIAENVPPGMPFGGDPRNPDSSVSKGRAVQKAVRSILLAVSGRAPKEFVPEGIVDRRTLSNATDLTKKVLREISTKVGVESITEETAPYFHKLFHSLLTGEVKSVDDLVRKYEEMESDFESLDRLAPATFRHLREALIATAKQQQGLTDKSAERLFREITSLGDEERKVRDRRELNEQRILEVIGRDAFAEKTLKLDRFYIAMESATSFDKYYRDLYERRRTPQEQKRLEGIIKERNDSITPERLREEVNRLAKEETAKEVHQKMIYLVNLLHQGVLAAAPNKQFNEVLREYSGAYGINPDTLFRQVTQRITAITTRTVGSAPKDEDNIYLEFAQEEHEEIDTVQRTTLANRNPAKEYRECRYDRFMEQLKTIAETERNVMEYGYNFSFATNKGPQGDKGFFEQIQQYAKESITSTDIDIITSVEYSELVQVAKIQLERRYKLAFSKLRWQRDRKFLREVFEATNAVDREIRETFMHDYAGTDPNKYPELIIDRCLAHARTLVYAKEFNLHLWASYADPRLDKFGKPTYSREELGGATAFNPVDDAIRWGEINDLNNNGELYLPIDGDFNVEDQKKAVNKGKKEFYESFRFGDAAFEKHPPAIARLGNICKVGGADALGGFRLQMSYGAWLDGLTNPNTGNRQLDVGNGKQDLLVEGWKRIENLGVNVIKNYTEEYLFTEDHLKALYRKDTKDKVLSKYKEMFGFWYDRYMNYDDSVGKAYVKGMTKEQYVKNLAEMMEKGDIKDVKGDESQGVKAEMYKVMSVMLFERSPLEFICMEKPRLTQNGVTLMSEVQNAFKTDPENRKDGRKPEKEFDDAVGDLVYIEQRARMDSLVEMEEIRKKNKLRGDSVNLYGDKKEMRSGVLKGKNKRGGYVVDEVYIKNTLEKQYEQDPDKKRKIDRAVKLYKEIQTRVQTKPEHNGEIDIYEGEAVVGDTPAEKAKEQEKNKEIMKKKLAKKEEGMQNRMEWWSKAWKDYKFGMTFSADTADQFLDRNNTGHDTIYNAAETCAGTAEAVKKAFGVELKKACKKAAIERSFNPIYEHMKALKDIVDVQDEGISKDIVMPIMARRVINAMSRDEKSLRGLFNSGEMGDVLASRPGSISQTYTGKQNMSYVWGWDKNDISDFLNGAHGESSGMVLSDKSKVDMLKRKSHSGRFEIFKRHLLPLLGASALGLFVYLLVQGNKENK